MKASKLARIAGSLVFAFGLAGCGTMDRQTVGTVGGAAVGGWAGSEATDGSTAGTIGGAALGGVIGSEVTRPR